MILSVTLNPSVDRTVFVNGLQIGDTNRVLKSEVDAGGKGVNLARVYSELGGDALAVGFLAGANGKFVQHVLDEQKVRHQFTWVDGETRTNISVEDGSGSPPTTFNEKGPNISESDWKQFVSEYEKVLPSANWVTVGGSLPAGVDPEAVFELMKIDPNKKIVVDADGNVMEAALNAKPFLIKPNADEASRLVGFQVESIDDAMRACKQLRERCNAVLLSMGAVGAILSWENGFWFGVPPTVKAVSTIGSGDSLLAGFLYGLSGGNVEEALRLGIACGAATAMTNGSEICRRPVIDTILSQVKVELISG